MKKRNIEPIRELRKICQKEKFENETGNLWFEWNFKRRESIYFTKLLLKIGISANQATLLSLLFALIGGFFLVFTDVKSLILSAVFLYLYLIFDCVDGEIARYTKTSSKLGSHLDFMVGTFVHPYAFICMTFGAYNALHDISIFAFGFLAVILNLLHEMHRISYEVKSANISKNTSEGESFVWKLYGLVKGVNNFLNPGAILYPILIVTALDICFAPLSISIPIIGLFAINARYAFLIVYSFGKIGSFMMKTHRLIHQ
ncbi:MAG: hypothetical protein DRP84_10265 [Spirochaetes bacterium]|nr:MAG: hypothetical protein DRP84_10265 [Spirochaetota bacterium]